MLSILLPLPDVSTLTMDFNIWVGVWSRGWSYKKHVLWSAVAILIFTQLFFSSIRAMHTDNWTVFPNRALHTLSLSQGAACFGPVSLCFLPPASLSTVQYAGVIIAAEEGERPPEAKYTVGARIQITLSSNTVTWMNKSQHIQSLRLKMEHRSHRLTGDILTYIYCVTLWPGL